MNMHQKCRSLTPDRERIVRQVESGQTAEAVVEAAGVCTRTVRKWVKSTSPRNRSRRHSRRARYAGSKASSKSLKFSRWAPTLAAFLGRMHLRCNGDVSCQRNIAAARHQPKRYCSPQQC